MRFPRFIGLLCILFAVHCVSSGAKPKTMAYIYNGPETVGDTRYTYHWEVLRAALDATSAKWGPYTLQASSFMTESRQLLEMQSETGRLNTMVLDTTQEMESKLLPVRLPVDKGLLGYRVFLIRQEDQAKFDEVHSLSDLKKFSIGQGFDWSDVSVFKAAGFQVVTGTEYNSLFRMLTAKRFDAFGRGVTEVLDEMKQFGPAEPDMVIEKNLLLYYPLPVYFWFPKSDDGQRRAKRVEEGMNIIHANGSFDRLFQKYNGETVKALNLKHRRIFRIKNPLLPDPNALAHSTWLFDPTR